MRGLIFGLIIGAITAVFGLTYYGLADIPIIEDLVSDRSTPNSSPVHSDETESSSYIILDIGLYDFPLTTLSLPAITSGSNFSQNWCPSVERVSANTEIAEWQHYSGSARNLGRRVDVSGFRGATITAIKDRETTDSYTARIICFYSAGSKKEYAIFKTVKIKKPPTWTRTSPSHWKINTDYGAGDGFTATCMINMNLQSECPWVEYRNTTTPATTTVGTNTRAKSCPSVDDVRNNRHISEWYTSVVPPNRAGLRANITRLGVVEIFAIKDGGATDRYTAKVICEYETSSSKDFVITKTVKINSRARRGYDLGQWITFINPGKGTGLAMRWFCTGDQFNRCEWNEYY